MYGVFGICNHDPSTVLASMPKWFEDAGQSPDKFRPKLLGFEPWTEEPTGLVALPTVGLFQQRFELLKKARAVLFLFDTAPLLEYLDVPILDLAEKHTSYQYRFKPLDPHTVVKLVLAAKQRQEHQKITSRDLDIIPKLLQQTQSSLLQPVLTYLYSVPTQERAAARSLIYKWLLLDRTVEELMARIPKTSQAKVLAKHLASEVGTNTHEAVKEMWQVRQQGKQPNTGKLSKKYALAEYDLKYLLQAIQKEQLNVLTPEGKNLETINEEVDA